MKIIDNFFYGFGNKLSFNNKKHLNKIISKIDYRVKSNDNKEKERYYILNFIPTIAEYGLLQFPSEVELVDTGEESNLPDFRINSNGHSYILEATMATTPELMKQLEKLRKKEEELLSTNKKISLEYNVGIENDEVKVYDIFGSAVYPIVTPYTMIKKIKFKIQITFYNISSLFKRTFNKGIKSFNPFRLRICK